MASLANVVFSALPWHRACSRCFLGAVCRCSGERVPRCRPLALPGAARPGSGGDLYPRVLLCLWGLVFYSWSVPRYFAAPAPGHDVPPGFPPGSAEDSKWPPVSHFVPARRRHAALASAGAGPAPARPRSGGLESLSGMQGPEFPLRSPARPQRVLAPRRGTAVTQRLKAVSAFKAATLLFYGFLLPPPPPPPPFHSVLLNKPEQLLKAPEPFQLLSEAAPRLPHLKAETRPCSGIASPQILPDLGGPAGHHEPPWAPLAAAHRSLLPETRLTAGLEAPVLAGPEDRAVNVLIPHSHRSSPLEHLWPAGPRRGAHRAPGPSRGLSQRGWLGFFTKTQSGEF